MQITDEAKEILAKILEENNSDCLRVSEVMSCSGTSLRFSLANMTEEDIKVSSNGITMVMDEELRERVENLGIGAEDGKLSVHDDAAPSCSSCSSCS